MQRNQLAPKQILAWCNALGDGNRLHTLVCNQAVDTPFGAVECVLGDLEPSAADASVGLGVADLLQVGHYRALVRGVNDIVGSGGEGMAPCHGYLGAGLDGYDGVGFGGAIIGWAVAGDGVASYVTDGLLFVSQ